MSLRYLCKRLRQRMYGFPQRIHRRYWKVGNHPFYKLFRMEFQQADHQMTNQRECYRLEDKLIQYQLADHQRWRNYLNLEYPQQNMPIDRLTFGQSPGWSQWGWRRWGRHWSHWYRERVRRRQGSNCRSIHPKHFRRWLSQLGYIQQDHQLLQLHLRHCDSHVCYRKDDRGRLDGWHWDYHRFHIELFP